MGRTSIVAVLSLIAAVGPALAQQGGAVHPVVAANQQTAINTFAAALAASAPTIVTTPTHGVGVVGGGQFPSAQPAPLAPYVPPAPVAPYMQPVPVAPSLQVAQVPPGTTGPTPFEPSEPLEPYVAARFGSDFEFGARTWVSTGKTDWNHTTDDPLGGDPRSALSYDDLAVLVAEAYGTAPLPWGFFVRGNVGKSITEISNGTLTDDDFINKSLATALGIPDRELRSEGIIKNADVFYITVDIGREIWRFMRNRGSFSIFGGFQYWKEEYDSFGVNQLEDPFNQIGLGQIVPLDTLALSNDVEWSSVRVGAIVSYDVWDKLNILLEGTIIPYSDMHNEDSHHLRTVFGPVPNVIMDGSGYGFQADLNVSYEIWQNFIATLGFRYWTLMSDGDITITLADGTSNTFTLNDLDSIRYGLTVGVTIRF